MRSASSLHETHHLLPPRTDTVAHPLRRPMRHGRPPSRWLMRSRWDVRVHGIEHVAADGPVVLAGNHVGLMDGPLLAAFAPRPVHVLTKVEAFTGVLGHVLTAAGQVPVDRFVVDPAAVRTGLRVLRDGGVVGIFPEGVRGDGWLDRFHRGAAYLALVTGAPVVPFTVVGTREPGGHTDSVPARGARLDLSFGEPLDLGRVDWPRTRELVAACSTTLRRRMLDHQTDALAHLGRTLPGPLPAGELEPEPGGGVTEHSR
ncbi:lysophospholipid acyltransferase family protein [Nocardioides sp. AX2bis]|uniref:lysophospholipid acyltransferase family protein n=1 Tax=Nocardioides sp. AX2bis TaxID=2653157 RepID=UPI0012F1D829|nr:lysophospholipid acyltransferase family protein [Nocardioides sp. AX2bis]VXC51221.1 1-acyl-sn-glycerol-3-phosphate acyltransferase [Nocardioides sp. AX2bis]